MASYSEQVAQYQELRRQGISGPQAAEMVWGPGGLAGAQENQRRDASSGQRSAAIGQLAGTLGGAYVAREGYNALFPSEAGAETTKTGASWLDRLISNASAQETTAQVAQNITQGTTAGAEALGQPASTFEGMFSSQPVNNLYTPIQDPNVPQGMTRINVQSGVDGSTVQATVPTETLNDPGFLDSINWGSVAQGAVGGMQLLQAYNAYKGGDKLGAGIYGATGAANIGAATGAFATGAGAGTMGAYVLPGLNIAAGLYGGYQTAQMLSDAAAGSQRTKQGALGGAGAGASIGAGIGSIVPGVGTAIGAGIGAVVGGLAGAIGSWTGSSKGKAQVMRDGIRGVLQQGGVLDQNYKGTLANGQLYDFGKDGSTLKWKEIDKIAERNPSSWGAAVNLADALATGYGFVGQKASDIAAWYAKAAVSNAGDNAEAAKQNVRHFAQQQGFNFDMIKQKLDQAFAENRIKQDQYNRYLAGAQDLFTGQPTPGVTTPGSQPIQSNIPRANENKVKGPAPYRKR